MTAAPAPAEAVEAVEPGRPEAGGLEPHPARPVLAVAAAVAVLLLAVASRYGYHRDELYFLEAGRHLAWGYVDQPPFTPFVARLTDAIAPGNLVALRLLPALATAATVLFGSLLVRELGGRRRAQLWGAGAMAASGFVLGAGHLLATATFDLTAWMALLWLATRLLRTDDPRWWLAFGAVAGVALLNKHLVVLLGVSLGAGLLATRRWRLLRSPWLLAGAALAALVAAPNLWWQATHGWPQVEMARVLSDRLAAESRSTLVPLQLLFAGPALAPLLWRGAVSLRGSETFRALLWAWPAGLVACFATAGRPYYVVPLTMAVLLAGLAAAERGPRWRAVPWLVVLNGLVSLPLALPLLPAGQADVVAAVNEAVAETVGWPELVGQVAAVVDTLPAGERDHVVLLAGSYGEAGAIDRFGPAHGLPAAHSPHNGYADFRRPVDQRATVVAVRFEPDHLERWFEDCAVARRVETPHDVDNEVRGAPITVCRGLQRPWPEVWEELRFLS